MLLDGRPKYQIKAFFRREYGLKSRQVERHLRLSRARLAEADDVDIDQMRAGFYHRYLRIYRESESDAVKISALRAASDLFGLNAPVKLARTTTKGTDISVIRDVVRELSLDELRLLRKTRDRMRQIAEGDDGHRN